MAQLSDDCFAHGGRLLRVEAALALLEERLSCVTGTERKELVACLGCVLREDLTAPFDVPPHPNSAVDGYAVRFSDLSPDGPTRLRIVGRIAAGEQSDLPLPAGGALRVFTGARLPEGPDTVFMQEDCRAEDGTVEVPPGIRRGANRRAAGEDIVAGSLVLSSGCRLRPQDLGQAAAIGRQALEVSLPLRVALFSTGSELTEPGSPLAPGAIYDSNRFTLAALLSGLGARVSDLGILPDRPEIIASALQEAAATHQLVITSGGVSVGAEDHVRQAVERQGRLHFWRLAIKPGRPVAMGQIGDTPFLGLPGNPVAVMVTFLTLARPAIFRLMGANPLPPQGFEVRADFSHRKKRERREWLRARLSRDAEGHPVAVKFARDGAGILSSLVEADGLVELPEDLTLLEPGAMVRFLPFSELR